MGSEKGSGGAPPKKSQGYGLIYFALLLAGILMLAQAAGYHPLQRVPAKLAIGLLYSALALFVGNGRPAGFIATAIIWLSVIATFLI
jgi:hypothetical protein